MFGSTLLLPVTLAALAVAQTAASGCVSSIISSPAGTSVGFFDPSTGEACTALVTNANEAAATPNAVASADTPAGYADPSDYDTPAGYDDPTPSSYDIPPVVNVTPAQPTIADPATTTPSALVTSAVPAVQNTTAAPLVDPTSAAPQGYITAPASAPPALSSITRVTSNIVTPVPIAGNASSAVPANGTASARILTAAGNATNPTSTPFRTLGGFAAPASNTSFGSPGRQTPSPTTPLASTGDAMQSAQMWAGSAGIVGFGLLLMAI